MATKPVKKPAVKKAATKKPTVKKTVKAAPAPEVKIIMDAPCDKNCACGRRRCTFGRFLGKLIIFLVIFGLGYCAGKMCTYKHHMRANFPRPEFVNGCMDLSSVKCPEMLNKVGIMDANADGCITKEEFRAAKKEIRKEFRNRKHDMRGEGRGCGGECLQRGPTPSVTE